MVIKVVRGGNSGWKSEGGGGEGWMKGMKKREVEERVWEGGRDEEGKQLKKEGVLGEKEVKK